MTLDLKTLIEQFPAPAAVYQGPEHHIVAASAAYRHITGGRDIVGRTFGDVFPELVEQGFLAILDGVLRTGEEVRGSSVPARWDTDGDGRPEERFVDFVYAPVAAEGGAGGILVLVTDVTERVRQEQARAFLAEAGEILSSSLEYETTLQSVTRLATAGIADWCAVDVLGPGRKIERIAVSHPDPAMVDRAFRFYERYPIDPDAEQGIAHVMRTGEPELVPRIPEEWLAANAPDEEYLEMVRALDLASYVCVPLVARERILGTLTLVRGRASEAYGADDLWMARELARRAAVSIDNARLYRDREEARVQAELQATELEAQSEELQLQAVQLEEIQQELEASTDELQRANARLEEERAQLEAVIDNAPVGIVIAEAPSGRIVRGNRRIEEIFRHPVWRSSGFDEYREWVIQDGDGRTLEPHEYPVAQALVTGRPSGAGDYRYVRGDGTPVWVRVTAAPILGADGRVARAVVLVDDIDEEKRSAEERERLLRQVASERQRLQQLFENAPSVMALYSGPEHVVTLVNPMWERSVGKPDAVGRPFREVFPEFGESGLAEVLDRVYESGESYTNPEVNVPLERWGSGERENTYWDLAYVPLPARSDGSRDILVHAVEITAQVRARQQVQGLTDAALAVHAAPTTAEVLQVITDRARQIVGAHQAVVSLTLDEEMAQGITSVSLSDKYASWREYAVPTDGNGIYSMVCETNQPVRLTQEELERHPRWRSFGGHADTHPPMRGWMAAPLIGRDGRNLGLIQLSDRYHGEFTEEDEAILVQLAQTASVAVENARLYQEAVEANETKSGFLATMSHELRTPLNAMIGYSDLLLLGVPDAISPAAQAQVERIRLSARHLLQLIEEILTFSRLEAGRERVDVEPVLLQDLALEVSAIIEPLAGTKSLTFVVEIPEEPVTLETDPRKVRQILLNLLGNAVKFTERGDIAFQSRVEADAIVLEVCDTGIGIARENLDDVFEPFWQAETAMHSRVGGTGLGLPVTAKLVHLLGGTLELESELGEGSTFRVRLPQRALPA